jgi:hypothetical protein
MLGTPVFQGAGGDSGQVIQARPGRRGVDQDLVGGGTQHGRERLVHLMISPAQDSEITPAARAPANVLARTGHGRWKV